MYAPSLVLGRAAPGGRPPDASVVIPVYNRSDMTVQCLNTLAQECPSVAHEVIVVSDGSTDNTPVVVRRYGGLFRFLHEPANRGFAAACNRGAAVAAGRHLVFLNNDTRPEPGWLEELVRVADTEPGVGAVGCKIVSWDGTRILHAGVVTAEMPGYPIYLVHLYRGAPRDFPGAGRQRDFGAVTGCCMLVPRAVFATAGGFDEGFVSSFEDVDLCFRLRERGLRVIYTPGAVIRHVEHASPGRHAHDPANYQRLAARWAGRVQADVHRYLQEDGYARDPFTGAG